MGPFSPSLGRCFICSFSKMLSRLSPSDQHPHYNYLKLVLMVLVNFQIRPCTICAGVKNAATAVALAAGVCARASVYVGRKRCRTEPPDRSMKCDCGGAGAAPDEVLGFDNAPTKNAPQAAAKWACRFSGVGSQVLVPSALQTLGGPRWGGEGRSGPLLFRKMEEKGERREGERRGGGGGCRFVCSCKLSLYGFE